MSGKSLCLNVFTVIFLCGCSSYRFQGNISHPVDTTLVSEKKYRVDTFMNKTDNGSSSMGQGSFAATDSWSLPGASEKLCASDICNALMRSNSKVFSETAESIPLAVEINTRSETKEGLWTMLFPYLLTLSIFPAHVHTPSQCEVTVVYMNDRSIRQSCIVDFRTESKLSVLSPIGMASFDSVPGAVSCRAGSGIMKAPHLDNGCLSDLQAVFTETLSAGIVKCIQEIENRSSLSASAPAKPLSVIETPSETEALKKKLRMLKELKESGVLTESEYESKRKALVDKI